MTGRTTTKIINTFIFTISFIVPITNILHRQRLSLNLRVQAMQCISATIANRKKSNRGFIIYGMRRFHWSFQIESRKLLSDAQLKFLNGETSFCPTVGQKQRAVVRGLTPNFYRRRQSAAAAASSSREHFHKVLLPLKGYPC